MFWVMIVASVLLGGFGCLSIMAGGMSDAPAEGDAAAKSGLIMALIATAIGVCAGILRYRGLL